MGKTGVCCCCCCCVDGVATVEEEVQAYGEELKSHLMGLAYVLINL